MENVKSYFNNSGIKRVIIFAILVFVLFLMRSMINVILITFIISFLMDRLVNLVLKKVNINRKFTVVSLYLLIIGLLSIGISRYLPMIIFEISQLISQMQSFFSQKHDNIILNYITAMYERNEISSYLEQGVTVLLKYFSDISTFGIQLLISLILSLFFVLEKPKLMKFTSKFKQSKVAPFYNEIAYFSSKFVQTFGKVIEAQFIIALVNCGLTTFALWIMDFPHLMGLSILIFFLGLIPVAGVIISIIPLSLIAYTIGGFMLVLYLLIVIMIIHAIEAYILNPKLMSSKTNLPVFYTFVVLIFGEHFFGVWGLIVGIPVFVFLLDVLGVQGNEESKDKLIKT
ncbi:AI-2E family transporter [Cytobacillus purgationiresistens]|uniref:PurR-regulated permease PerM n=1 Tax=Cytobacillus purgationiresistens TaxID=863449 RepID=A0ABU0ABV4_9BACI|nr:AI-2E family transporter [Cytobacillus purgationiresistens]MDQ0268354.1 putative PurR-regulated permease PerM [Cytobacillus purgationiresistens]